MRAADDDALAQRTQLAASTAALSDAQRRLAQVRRAAQNVVGVAHTTCLSLRQAEARCAALESVNATLSAVESRLQLADDDAASRVSRRCAVVRRRAIDLTARAQNLQFAAFVDAEHAARQHFERLSRTHDAVLSSLARRRQVPIITIFFFLAFVGLV